MRTIKAIHQGSPERKTEYVHERDFHIMEPEQRMQIGSLEIEMLPVDHSLPEHVVISSIQMKGT